MALIALQWRIARSRGHVHSAFDEVVSMSGFNWHNPYPTTRIPVFALN